MDGLGSPDRRLPTTGNVPPTLAHFRIARPALGLAGALTLLTVSAPAALSQSAGGFTNCITGSWTSATVILPDAPALSFPSGPLEAGDQIAAFALDGTCVGVAQWDGTATALTVWADDPLTVELDGLQPGEPVALAVWDQSENATVPAGAVAASFDPTFAPSDGFTADDLYVVVAATGTEGLDDGGAPLAATLGAPFPNPTPDRARIPFTLAARADVTVEVFDTLGRLVASPLEGASLVAGDHTVPVDATALAGGVYVVRVRVDEAVLQTRLTVSR